MLSALQQHWLTERANNGRSVVVVVGCKEGGVWYSAHQWTTAMRADEFRSALMSRTDIAARISSIVYG